MATFEALSRDDRADETFSFASVGNTFNDFDVLSFEFNTVFDSAVLETVTGFYVKLSLSVDNIFLFPSQVLCVIEFFEMFFFQWTLLFFLPLAKCNLSNSRSSFCFTFFVLFFFLLTV